MTDIRSRLADALNKHWWNHPRCSCGWELPEYSSVVGPHFTKHVASELLSLPGIAIVELPEPDSTRYEGDEHEPEDRLAWKPNGCTEVSVWHDNAVQVSLLREVFWEAEEPITAGAARALAAALLAAAVQAQEEQP